MNHCTDEQLRQKMDGATQLWLFLDYDGTLADFAPTPEDILPDAALISLITALAGRPDTRVTIISGRRLAHIQALLPVPGLLLAGTYGLELQTPAGELIHRLDYEQVRPLMDRLKGTWDALLTGRTGFFLEDKGWTLAIHAKDAPEAAAEEILSQARAQAAVLLAGTGGELFRLQGGHRFLECGPLAADKKRTVEHLLSAYPWVEDPLLVYLGDDDKDEVAFEAIQEHRGLVVAVGNRLRHSAADCWLPSPQAVRRWLQTLV